MNANPSGISLRAKRQDDDMVLDNLAALVPVPALQQVQDAFSSALGIPLLFVSPAGGPLTRSESIETFCAHMTRKIESKRPCGQCGRHEKRYAEAGAPQLHSCPLGLQDVSVPIRVSDSLVGYLVTSQVSTETATSEKLIEVAQGLSAIVKLTSELATANHHRRWTEINDPLTKIANRSRFWECLTKELELSDTHNFPVSVLMIDLDDLKKINDSYGHETGDRVLATVAETITKELRASDLAGRYTNDSFLALLRGTDEFGAQAVSTRLQNKVSQVKLTVNEQDLPISISIGSVTYPMCAARDADSVVREAHAALRAKRSGSAAKELPIAA